MENLQYNTDRKPLIIPEYGRHIHVMVGQLLDIEDREQRNKMAKAIIGVMGNLNPHLRDVPDFQHKLWDQLFIMSEFELDVDSPFEKPEAEVLAMKPDKLPYPQNHPKYRFYGNNIKRMIDVAVNWDENNRKELLAYTIANHMKKSFLMWNKDTVDDALILTHLSELSNGELVVSDQMLPLKDSAEILKYKSKAGNTPKNKRAKRSRKRQ